MSSAAPKTHTDKRRDVRAKLNLRVAYGTAFDVQTTAYMQNIGHGGVFIRTENPLEIGAVVDLEFSLLAITVVPERGEGTRAALEVAG